VCFDDDNIASHRPAGFVLLVRVLYSWIELALEDAVYEFGGFEESPTRWIASWIGMDCGTVGEKPKVTAISS
jgi:hypothetical protein